MLRKEPGSQIQLLLQRLERISADSRWAHLASGYRGSLIKMLDLLELGATLGDEDTERLNRLMDGGTIILHNAARERIGKRGM